MPANAEEITLYDLMTNETLRELNEEFLRVLEEWYYTPRELRTLELTSPYPPDLG